MEPSGTSLISTAIILWNTADLEHATQALENNKNVVASEILPHVFPLD